MRVLFLSPAWRSMLLTVPWHIVLQNPSLVQKSHCALLTKTLVSDILEQIVFWEMSQTGGVPLAIIQFHESNATEYSSIWGLVSILQQVATRLLKTFRDILRIWSRGIKYKPSGISEFHKLLQVLFSKVHVNLLPKIASHGVLQNSPSIHKLHYALLRKTLISKIVEQTIFLATKS
jgi:hypothetical protein